MTDVTMDLADLTDQAGRAVAAALGEPDLAVGTPTRDLSGVELSGHAVVVDLRGPRAGQLLVVVTSEVSARLAPSGGSADVARAVRPLLESAADALGFSLGSEPEVLEPSLAVNAILADPRSSTVTLTDRSQLRAVVGVRLAEDSPAVASHDPARRASVPTDRLDLLRGVAMDVTVEIGRTRMTVGDLLGLSDGSVIELDRSAGAPADLLVNGRLIAHGEVVVVDENFGLRITEIVTADAER